jgi:hypothetical protein
MGHAHFVRCDPASTAYRSAWPRILADTGRIIDVLAERGMALAGPTGDGTPILHPARGIAFNGVAATDDDYDSFTLPSPGHGKGTWWFCKTNHRRYDLAVTAVLLRCHLLLPDTVAISSDGDWETDWRPARDLVDELFGGVPQACPFRDTTPERWR